MGTCTCFIIVCEPELNFQQWYTWKQGRGIYILTREKESMKFPVFDEDYIDRADPCNIGVVADHMVGNGPDIMPWQLACETPINTLVKEDPTPGQEFSPLPPRRTESPVPA